MHGWILTARCTCASSRSLSGACAEVFLNRGLGYGTYAVTVRDASHFEPAVVFSMITFDESGGDQYYRELDVEISRWGDAASKNRSRYASDALGIWTRKLQEREGTICLWNNCDRST